MKKTLLLCMAALTGLAGQAAAQTVYSTAFGPADDNTAWTMSSATVNQWHIGRPAAEAADTGWLYISQDGGTANTYDLTASTKAWASHDVTLAGGVYTFSFRWKCNGEGIWDYLRCVLVPDTTVLDTTPFATFQEAAEFRFAMPDGWINLTPNVFLNQSTQWQTSTISFSVLNPGNYKIAFLWVNDNSAGYQPPAVVDDVTLAIDNTCPPVAHLELTHVSPDSAALTWDAVYGAQYLVQIDTLAPVVVGTNRYVIPFVKDVHISVTARVWTLCTSGDTSVVSQKYFYNSGSYYTNNSNIGCSAYGLPYFEDFDPNTSNNMGFCWWVRQTTEYTGITSPLIWSNRGIGNSAALWFGRYINGNSYGMLYSPYFDAPANELDVSFWMRVIAPGGTTGEVSGANASLTIGVADDDIEGAAANIFCSQSFLHFDYADLDTAWQLVHFTTDTLDMSIIDGNVRLAFLWMGNTAGIYIDNLQVTRLGVAPDSVPPTVVIGGPSVVQVLDTVAYRADLVEGTDSAMIYSWHSAMAAAGQATVLSTGDTLRIVYTAMGTDTLILTAANPYGSDTAVRHIAAEGAPQVRIAFAPFNVNNGIWLTYTHEYLGGPNVPYTIRWHSDLAAAGLAQVDTTHGDTLRIRYIGSGNDMITLTAGNIFDTTVAKRPVVVGGCVVDTFPFTAIYTYDGVIDNACWLKLQHGGGSDILYEGWGYSTATEGGLECMHWNDQPAAEYLLVMPPLALPSSELQLRFKATGTAVTGGMFSVVVSPSGESDAFTDTLTLAPDSVADYYTASLTPYAGNLVLVAFRMAVPAGVGASVSVLREVSITATAPLAPDTVWRTVTVGTNADDACEPYGSGVYADGDTVEIGFLYADTAVAGGHWQFIGWSDGGEGNPRSIVVVSDTTVNALFQWVADSVGISDLQAPDSDLRVYPNPASSDVTVSVGRPATVTVLDLAGRIVIPPTPVISDFRIQISELPTGTYFVRATTADGTSVAKLIVVQ